MKVSLETITPSEAKVYLALQKNCRNKSNSTVEAYLLDMLSGRWQEGSTIVFDKHGRLRDGQHRLNTQVKADVTLTYTVIRDATEEFIETIDQGTKRPINVVAQEHHKACQAARLVARIENSATSKLTVGSVKTGIQQIGREHIYSVLTITKNSLNASIFTALCLCRPVSPAVVDALAAQLSRRDGNSSEGCELGRVLERPLTDEERVTLSSLVALANSNVLNGDSVGPRGCKGIFYRACAGVLHFINGVSCATLRNTTTAYDAVKKARRNVGAVHEFKF